MSDLIRTRVMLPPGSPVERGPQWTDLWIREGTSDEAVLDEVWVSDVYRARGLGLVKPADNEYGRGIAPLVVDLGANIGCFTALMCAMYPDVRVIAVEPDLLNLDLLRRNVKRFGQRVEIRSCAVGGFAGRGTVLGAEGTARVDAGGGVVEIVTLDALLAEQRVALLKCDIEGAEYDALTDADLTAVDRIAMEWHGPETCPHLEEAIATYGVWGLERIYGGLLAHLAETHAVQVFGHPTLGGMLFAQRYDLEG